jgi:hypothetical protein
MPLYRNSLWGMFLYKTFYDKIGCTCVEHQIHTVCDVDDWNREESEGMLGIDARMVKVNVPQTQ